ncbi:MAG: nucleotidyl transferase AbiEii/AbiGii toxin family protein [Bacteroidia bacterium]
MKLNLHKKFSEKIPLVATVFESLEIKYYLLGAQVRDIRLGDVGKISSRITNDIDFAIMLTEVNEYEKVAQKLYSLGFGKLGDTKFCIGEKENKVEIDIIPFSNLQNIDVRKYIQETFEYSIVGYQEVAQFSEVEIIEGKEINVASVAGIFILKLVSWTEKSERLKDLEDLYEILLCCGEIFSDEFYDKYAVNLHNEFQDDYQFEFGVFMLGTHIAPILQQSETLSAHIHAIIQKEMQDKAGKMTTYWINRNFLQEVKQSRRLFQLLLQGINYV